MNAGSVMRGVPAGAERAAKQLDHAAERDRFRLHQIPDHGIGAVVPDIAAGKPGNRGGDIFDRHAAGKALRDSRAGRSNGNAASARTMALPP